MKYYVYQHKHPVTREVVYIGKGCRERAYKMRAASRPGHRIWIDELEDAGYVAGDWVEMIQQNLDEGTALEIERRHIGLTKPRFNTKHI